MSKFLAVAGFEIRYYLRRISTWVYFGILFLLGLLVMAASAGVWDSVNVGSSGVGGIVYANSPYSVLGLVTTISFFGILITAAILGNSIFRDFENGIYPLFFAAPISRFTYLGGRFTGALLVNAVILLAPSLGTMAGTLVPGVESERMGEFQLGAYLAPYLVFVLPTLVFTGAIFFATAALTRKMLSNYLGGAILLVGYLLAEQLMADMDNRTVAALIDPFGTSAVTDLTRYWSAAERNTRLVWFEGTVLWNRILWVGIGLLVFAGAFWRFRFSHGAPAPLLRWRRGRPQPAAPEAESAPRVRPRTLVLPDTAREFGFAAQFRQYLAFARISVREVVLNRYFLGIVVTGVLFLIFFATQVGGLYGTETWPVTYSVAEELSGAFGLFIIIIITFYAGDLVWRERDLRLAQIYDATPMPNWVPLLGKFTALVAVVAILQVLVLVAGLITQLSAGYFKFELGLYLRMLLGVSMIGYVLMIALIMTVHVVVNHKYVGHLIVILFFVFQGFASQFGVEHLMLTYGSHSGMVYSDMNSFGPFAVPFVWFSLYWAVWALAFALLSNLLWSRGEGGGARWRLRMARLRATQPVLRGAAVLVILMMTLGGFIFYNTNVVNEYSTSFEREAERARYERQYKQFEGIPQPRVVSVDIRAELYPDEGDATLQGEYWLLNKTSAPIDSLHFLINPRVEIRAIEVDRAGRRALWDTDLGYHIYDLDSALEPGDSVRVNFDLAIVSEGFANGVSNVDIVGNGTFINSSLMPGVGYRDIYELNDDATRRKHDLEPRDRMKSIDDPAGLENNYISTDADLTRFAATVGTVPDQIAVAPGYLQREWEENGRRYFRYEMDAPIVHFYSILSARYEVRRDQWNDVAIEIFYHPTHEFNIDRMVDAIKKSLAYYSEKFGPYQHRQVRVLEFPRYSAFAQAFPNTIPYSEAIGFIAKPSEGDIDYPFYVTAHEVAHQWWAHQVIGADVQGSTFLVEGMAQYSALMVMEEEFGREEIGNFLKYELDQYLAGRTAEREKELPLLFNENQQYIHYNKGAVAMYALRDYIGEDAVNGALSQFIRDWAYTGPPYPTSLDLYGYLQAATPDSLRSIVDDLFREITFWDLRATDASYVRSSTGRFEVVIDIEANKARADSLGNEINLDMGDPIDIGVFGPAEDGEEEGPILYLQKHRIRSGEQKITITVDSEPARAGIDPHHKLIDRITDDNVVDVDERQPG